MRKKLTALLVLLALVATFATSAVASTDRIRVFVDGKEVSFPDQQPYLDKNARTLVPVRFVSETLGAEVGWNGGKQEVSVDHQVRAKKILLWVDKKDYTINGAKATMDTNAVITSQARVMVPLRFVSEALGARVEWSVVAKNGLVHTFTLDQTDAEVAEIIKQTEDKVKGEAGTVTPPKEPEKPAGVTVIPENEWSTKKPVVGSGTAYYFSDPNTKIAYAKASQLPIQTKYYTIKDIKLTKEFIEISYDTPEKTTPKLYITKGDYLWVRNAYLHDKTSIVYKYPIEAYGDDDNPLSYDKLKTVDYLNICLGDYILAIENPFKGVK